MPITPSGDFISVDQDAHLAQLAAEHEAALLAAEAPEAAVIAREAALLAAENPDTTAVEHSRRAVEAVDPEERTYMMLQQRSLAETLLEAVAKLDVPLAPESQAAKLLGAIVETFGDTIVFEQLGPRVARNAEHAYRLIAKERLGDEPGRLELVAIAAKMWKPKPVSSSVRQNYSVG